MPLFVPSGLKQMARTWLQPGVQVGAQPVGQPRQPTAQAQPQGWPSSAIGQSNPLFPGIAPPVQQQNQQPYGAGVQQPSPYQTLAPPRQPQPQRPRWWPEDVGYPLRTPQERFDQTQFERLFPWLM